MRECIPHRHNINFVLHCKTFGDRGPSRQGRTGRDIKWEARGEITPPYHQFLDPLLHQSLRNVARLGLLPQALLDLPPNETKLI